LRGKPSIHVYLVIDSLSPANTKKVAKVAFVKGALVEEIRLVKPSKTEQDPEAGGGSVVGRGDSGCGDR
jgi:hypothetical protein